MAVPRPPQFVPVRWLLASAALLCVGGCKVGPDYKAPVIVAQPAFGGVAGRVDGADYGGDVDLERWWQSFGDPAMTGLVLRASAGNLDLQEAAARVVEARYARAASAGELLPSLNGDASYMRQRVSQSLGFSTAGGSGTAGAGNGTATGGTNTGNAGGSGGTTGVGSGGGGTSEFNIWDVGGSASWELDLFGRLRRVVESQDARFQASIEDFRGVFVSLAADTARSYVRIRETQDRRAVAVANANTQRRALDLAQTRLDTGLGSKLDVSQARANLEQTLATLPALEQSLRLEKNALAVLLGERPGTVDAAVDELSPPQYQDRGGARKSDPPVTNRVPRVPARLAVGIPADLIRRRPDLRRDERLLAAQTALVGARVGDLYPRLALAGTVGLTALDAGNLFEGNSFRYGVGPDISWPIFQGGSLRALVGQQAAVRDEALITYQRTLLTAFREVADALTTISQQGKRVDRLLAAEDAAQQAVDAAESQYLEGLTDFNRVITTQQTLLAIQDSRVLAQGSAALATIDLYSALGGGWPVPAQAPDLPDSPPSYPAPDLVPPNPADLRYHDRPATMPAAPTTEPAEASA